MKNEWLEEEGLLSHEVYSEYIKPFTEKTEYNGPGEYWAKWNNNEGLYSKVYFQENNDNDKFRFLVFKGEDPSQGMCYEWDNLDAFGELRLRK